MPDSGDLSYTASSTLNSHLTNNSGRGQQKVNHIISALVFFIKKENDQKNTERFMGWSESLRKKNSNNIF
jgi:hypothetical protein